MTITSIISQLEKLAQQLDADKMSTESLADMTNLSRLLHEKMVILQHEASKPIEVKAEVKLPPSEAAEPEVKFVTPEIEVSPNQISLIDSIEEIHRMEGSLNEAFSDGQQGSLSDKIGNQGILDLEAAISINQKFKFMSNLFDGDSEAYNESLSKLNGFSSFLEADEYIENVVKHRFDWESKNPVVKDFMNLIERKFL